MMLQLLISSYKMLECIMVINIIKSMTSNYKNFLTNLNIPGGPMTSYDTIKKNFVHIYQNVTLEPSNFQKEVNLYLNRKESYSGNVVAINKIKDQHITYHLGKAAMEISVVTDYVPWRLHVEKNKISYEQALFLLKGSCKGFRQLLHRVRFPFMIQQSMIGVDGNGDVKVWWNQLFYKSNFGFAMSANIKLRDMVKSLIDIVLQRTQIAHAFRLQDLIADSQATLASLQERIQEISIGTNFKDVGKNLILKNVEHMHIIKQSKSSLGSMKQNSIMNGSRLSNNSGKANFSSQKLILSPRKTQFLEFNKKIITKRSYRDGTSPSPDIKMKIIKEDIENLRSVVDKNEPIQFLQSRLRSSKSVESLISYRKGLKGDQSIPQIKKIIKQQEVIGKAQDITISRFIEPTIQSHTSILDNPEYYSPYKHVRMEKDQTDPVFLSNLQSLIGQEKSYISTSRSINEHKIEKQISTESQKPKFGDNERKLPQSMYFTSLFEI